jgi:hypothetical protein
MVVCWYCAFQEASMVLRNIFSAIICATMLAWSGLSFADEYRPDEFLSLDLSKAVLSPKPLGPASGFAPGPLDVPADRGNAGAQARTESGVQARTESKSNGEPKVVIHNTRVTHLRAEPPRHAARTKLVDHHRNPVDAQAFDARVQVWPCKSGGICNWKR